MSVGLINHKSYLFKLFSYSREFVWESAIEFLNICFKVLVVFKKKQNKLSTKPTPKGLYAWNFLHAGSFLLYVETLKDCHKFLFLPGPSEYFLTFEDFSKCINSNTLEFVEPLPDEIFEESIKISLACPSAPSNIVINESTKN